MEFFLFFLDACVWSEALFLKSTSNAEHFIQDVFLNPPMQCVTTGDHTPYQRRRKKTCSIAFLHSSITSPILPCQWFHIARSRSLAEWLPLDIPVLAAQHVFSSLELLSAEAEVVRAALCSPCPVTECVDGMGLRMMVSALLQGTLWKGHRKSRHLVGTVGRIPP